MSTIHFVQEKKKQRTIQNEEVDKIYLVKKTSPDNIRLIFINKLFIVMT